ncbi:hypothetical protein MC885_005239 [Smutsia gigantea]|nr:hypothetical protein MC885_005239 [Smutsia gigantea]
MPRRQVSLRVPARPAGAVGDATGRQRLLGDPLDAESPKRGAGGVVRAPHAASRTHFLHSNRSGPRCSPAASSSSEKTQEPPATAPLFLPTPPPRPQLPPRSSPGHTSGPTRPPLFLRLGLAFAVLLFQLLAKIWQQRAMDQYSTGEEGALPSKVPLLSLSESEGLNCSSALNQDLGPSSRDLLYAGLNGLGLDPSLLAPSVPTRKDSDSLKVLEEHADPESQASLQDLEPGVLKVPREADEGGRATSRTARKGRRQRVPRIAASAGRCSATPALLTSTTCRTARNGNMSA